MSCKFNILFYIYNSVLFNNESYSKYKKQSKKLLS